MDGHVFWIAFVLPVFFTIVFTLVGGLLIVLAMKQRSLTLEMKHRERMAMIEKGVVPEPGRDPAAFEMWQQQHERPASRATSAGVMVVALGLGLMLIISFAGGAPDVGVGIGGSIVVLGAALIVLGELKRRSQPPQVPFRPSEPPGSVGP